jgi:hypothetical protein
MIANRENVLRVASQKVAQIITPGGADDVCYLPIIGDKLQTTSQSTLKVFIFWGGLGCLVRVVVWNDEVQFLLQILRFSE